jgi:hypothetical protein
LDLVIEELKEEVLELLAHDKKTKARQISAQIRSVDTSNLRSKREAHRFEMLLRRVKRYYEVAELEHLKIMQAFAS